MLWKYAANLQENTHAEVWFQLVTLAEVTLQHGCSHEDLLHIFRKTFLKVAASVYIYHPSKKNPYWNVSATQCYKFLYKNNNCSINKTKKVSKLLQQELNYAIYINFCLLSRNKRLINYGCNIHDLTKKPSIFHH